MRVSSWKSLLALPVACTLCVHAQTITAGVNGTVTDATGAIVPNVKVTATNTATNVSNDTQSNGAGVFVIRNLQVGSYKLTLTAPGFTTQSIGPFTLESGQEAKLDAKLGVEGSTTNVTVSSDLVPLLNTENATLGSTLDTNAINTITLVGRNFTELTLFAPGAVSGNPAGFTGSNAIERNDTNTIASQNGNRQETNNFLLEGIDINETINNGIGYSPSPDAIGQVRIVTLNAPAEFGNVSGGDIITLLKSGTNGFHGSAFGYLSNYNMDANSYASKHVLAGTAFKPITPYTQTIFGGTFGGPILRDKLFFFTDYQGARYHSAGVGLATVLTAKMRTGDFSELLDRNLSSQQIQLYNTQAAGQPAYVNNQIGAVSNPIAAYLFAHPEYYPLPNRAASLGTVIQHNYSAPTKTNRYNDQFDAKIDWTPGTRDKISGSYSHGKSGDTTIPVLAITFPGANVFPFQSFAFNSVHTFTPQLVNEFTAGYTRIVNLGAIPTDTTGAFGTNGNTVVGLTGISQAQVGFIGQNFNGTNGNFNDGGVGNSSTGTTYYDNTFSYYDNLTYQFGRHTIKGGVQILRYQQNTFYPGNDGAVGHYDYNGAFTAQYGTAGGYSEADFYKGYVSTRAIGGVTGLSGQRSYRDAAFLQDDWKATPNLTLNLGIRWEYDQPIYEVNNKEANINFATKKVQLAGVGGASRALYDPVYTNFMPRVGFAYSPNQRMVVRGGYGITNYFEGTGANLRLNFNYPFQNAFTATAFSPTANSAGTYFTPSQGFGSATVGCDITTSTTPCTTVIRAWQQNIKPMLVQEYDLAVEYQFNNTASVTVAYVGELGQHLITAGAANALTSVCIDPVLKTPTSTLTACAATNPAPFINLVGQAGQVVYTGSQAYENYSALQTTYRQRLSRGLEFTANYTWAKALTNSTGFFGSQGVNGQSPYAQNFYNNAAEYGPAAQDIRNNFNGHLTYALPVGRGRQFGSNMNRVLDEVIGGWQVAATTLVYSGFPVNMGLNNNNSDTGNRSQRANVYRKLHVVNRTASQWFGNDPSALSALPGSNVLDPKTNCGTAGIDNGRCAYGRPADGTFGTASVDSERAPGYQSADASVFKDFNITEHQHFTFRADAANVFNMTSLGNPVNDPTAGNFGNITDSRSQARQLQLSLKYAF